MTARATRASLAKSRARRLSEAMDILRSLGFAPRQSNEVAGYTLLALLDLRPGQTWSEATAPLRDITPIIEFVDEVYGVCYAPNGRIISSSSTASDSWDRIQTPCLRSRKGRL